MIQRLLIITIIVLFIGSCISSSVSTVESKNTISDSHKVKIYINNQDSTLEFSYDDVEQIKNRLLEIEKNYVGKEKINEQIKIFKELEVLPSDFSTDVLFSVLDIYNSVKNTNLYFFLFGLIIGGPMVVSHLTIGGRIHYLFHLKPSVTNQTYIYFNEPFNNSFLNITYGYLRTYAGYSILPVYITIVGLKIFRGQKNPIFPFFEVLIPCVGFSIAFTYENADSKPITLFEYNLDACLLGFIVCF